MTKTCASAIASIALLLMSCTTVEIKTIPEHATLSLRDGTVAAPPYLLTVPFFQTATVHVSHEGYQDKTIQVDRFPLGVRTVRLTPICNVTSDPPGANVTLNGKTVGKTPLTCNLEDHTQDATLTVAKPGFLPRVIPIPHQTPPAHISCQLLPDGPGRHICRLLFTSYGFPLIRQILDDSLDLAKPPRDAAESLIVFPKNAFPAYITTIQNSPDLLIASLQRSDDQGIPRPNAFIQRFSEQDRTLIPYTPGHYFDISAAIAQDTLFYSSMQTGRFDIWSRSLNPQMTKQELVLSNNQVKVQLTARGSQLLFTAFNPQDPQDPRVWCATVDGIYLTSLRELCNGDQPTWPHRGRNILYQKLTDHISSQTCWFPKTKIWTVQSDGALKRQISDNHDCVDKNPAWTLDDRHILFASNRNQKNPNNFNIWIMDATGKNLRQLTDSPAMDDFPVPSADGKAVIFRSNRNLTWGLWKISLPKDAQRAAPDSILP